MTIGGVGVRRGGWRRVGWATGEWEVGGGEERWCGEDGREEEGSSHRAGDGWHERCGGGPGRRGDVFGWVRKRRNGRESERGVRVGERRRGIHGGTASVACEGSSIELLGEESGSFPGAGGEGGGLATYEYGGAIEQWVGKEAVVS